MDGGAWWATVHGVTELDMMEQIQYTLNETNDIFIIIKK